MPVLRKSGHSYPTCHPYVESSGISRFKTLEVVNTIAENDLQRYVDLQLNRNNVVEDH